MGAEHSQADYDRVALEFYEGALRSNCFLQDVGIDDSLYKYSAINSSTALQTYSDGLRQVPNYIDSLGTRLAPFTSVPNAVGLGALVLSMVMEFILKSPTQETADSYSMLQRIFGQEKASAVRDTMSEYLKRHSMHMFDEEHLRMDTRRLEQQLSNHLTILRNSLLHDEQMSSRGLKIWVNGAAFHIQMLIHDARLNIQAGQAASRYETSIKAAVTSYIGTLETLLAKYKTYLTGTISFYRSLCERFSDCLLYGDVCILQSTEVTDRLCQPEQVLFLCGYKQVTEAYINNVFSKYEPLTSLKPYFLRVQRDVSKLIRQRSSFTLPQRRGK